jgi:addiction module HigA family antidote
MVRYIEIDHPGVLLKEDFLDDMGIKPATLAKAIGVTRSTVSKIIAGERDITADMSIRLGQFFGVSDQYWLRIQNNYDLIMAHRKRESEKAQRIPVYTSVTDGAWASV